MFCSNCGKKLPDDAKYCDACGTIAGSDEKEQSSYSKDSTTYQSNNDPIENTESPFTNAAYNLGVTQAQNGYIEQPISYQPNNHKKLWGREITIPIAAISLAVVLVFIGFSVYSTFKTQRYGAQDNRVHQQYGAHNYGNIPDSGGYDEYGDFLINTVIISVNTAAVITMETETTMAAAVIPAAVIKDTEIIMVQAATAVMETETTELPGTTAAVMETEITAVQADR